MIEMKARQAFRYAGRQLAVGDWFSVKGIGDARLLSAMKRADIVPARSLVVEKPPVKTLKRTYKTRAMTAETPEAPAAFQGERED